MKKSIKLSSLILVSILLVSYIFIGHTVLASNEQEQVEISTETEENIDKEGLSLSGKAIGSGIAIGLAGLGGALGMGIAISKSVDGISRQPEAEGKIRSTMMIGVVFIETVVIYALIVSILVIFVL